jgi:hypothetical protein
MLHAHPGKSQSAMEFSVMIFRLPQALVRSSVGAALCALVLGAALPAGAIIRLDSKSIDAALVYGMKHQKLGLSTLLGPNWVEGTDGALLNVYSPFMMVASKAAKAKFPMNPSKSDLKKAREKFGKEVAFYSDPKNRQQVKFSVSFYGNSLEFAKEYHARIVGFGRGKEFDIKPHKEILDQKADPAGNLYEGINAYYFNMADIEDLQEFRLVLESPKGNPVTFRLRNEKLY